MSSLELHNFTDRLNFLVEKLADGNQRAFARKCKIAPNTFNRYANGREPKISYLVPIWETYNVNLHWLITGEGNIYIKNSDNNIKRDEFEKELSSIRDEIDILKGKPHFNKKGNAA